MYKRDVFIESFVYRRGGVFTMAKWGSCGEWAHLTLLPAVESRKKAQEAQKKDFTGNNIITLWVKEVFSISRSLFAPSAPFCGRTALSRLTLCCMQHKVRCARGRYLALETAVPGR